MGESEKPFACPSPGCNMSFTNEDHLVVHKKKHDMVLNLGNNGKNTFVADQTPTPTRFIRNCEEVGLFQDLQNVNPFEETFRRAVEDGKTVALSEPEGVGTDDTLHTPHIFPNLPETSMTTVEPSADNPKESETLSREHGNDGTKNEAAVEVKKLEESKRADPVNRIVVQEVTKFIAPKIIETTKACTNLSINGQEVQLLLKTADGKLMQLSTVPVCENQVDAIEIRNVQTKVEEPSKEIKKNPSSNGNRLNFAKMRLKQTLTKNSSPSNEISKNSSDHVEKLKSNKNSPEKNFPNSEQCRKQDVLARNRASSMRARAKRKAWIQQLQKAASNANEKNALLQLEIKALRSEVTRLRTLLFAHQNCPITKSMEKGAVIGLEAKNAEIVETIVSSSQPQISTRVKRISTSETPIAPKIPKISLNPPILPKLAEAKQSFVVNDLSAVKIVDVRSIPEDEMKKIVLVDSSHKRIEFVKSAPRQQIIHINPTILQIENAASKCTGT
ncbi:cyclic AMP-dependent transcription factor ATF-7 isoform X2 [Venturia canescens]|uniref:cyclic AMP-dependent transcription factor ATF-7 isoform X2 n=1 Tax=Venturia canescens TaxID=32260 RepID=UPI001C9C1DEE|nr:cyclic AMP-dependent transcription factor ATF-7 isoform X2 [Venturia canescens]